MKIILDLNKVLKGLDGVEVEGQDHVCKLVGNLFANSTEGDAIKLYTFGVQLYETGILDVDQSDYDMIKKIINESKAITNLAKGQILNMMQSALLKAEEKKEKKDKKG